MIAETSLAAAEIELLMEALAIAASRREAQARAVKFGRHHDNKAAAMRTLRAKLAKGPRPRIVFLSGWMNDQYQTRAKPLIASELPDWKQDQAETSRLPRDKADRNYDATLSAVADAVSEK